MQSPRRSFFIPSFMYLYFNLKKNNFPQLLCGSWARWYNPHLPQLQALKAGGETCSEETESPQPLGSHGWLCSSAVAVRVRSCLWVACRAGVRQLLSHGRPLKGTLQPLQAPCPTASSEMTGHLRSPPWGGVAWVRDRSLWISTAVPISPPISPQN